MRPSSVFCYFASPTLLFEVTDLRVKIRLERQLRDMRKKPGFNEEDATTEVLAQRCGLLPPTSFSIESLQRRQQELQELVREQRERRVAQRGAFLEWRAGQREKGAARRLQVQARKAERYKRMQCETAKHRFLEVTLGRSRMSTLETSMPQITELRSGDQNLGSTGGDFTAVRLSAAHPLSTAFPRPSSPSPPRLTER